MFVMFISAVLALPSQTSLGVKMKLTDGCILMKVTVMVMMHV